MARRSSSPARKSIFDPVHGIILLEGAPLALVGHPVFQRLWGIRQTGFAHLVFPGANHTRLEHSLGVYWVARRLAETLGLPREDAAALAAGGLLHDLGHAPFSHTLDPPMREVLGFGHERVSRDLILGRLPNGHAGTRGIDALLIDHGIEPGRVADLVDPRRSGPGRPLLQSLLHGAIDADRIDYLQRDAHYTGVAHGAIDATRLLDTARGWRGHLAFAEKGRSAVEGFLVGRTLMYASVYYHKTVRAAEMMCQAAVERLPGYPSSAGGLFQARDAELLAALDRAGGISREIARGLLDRRLYKRIAGYRTIDGAARRRWSRLARHPPERREFEDRLAQTLGGPPGSVLVDLSGLNAREPGGGDWNDVGVLEGRTVRYPFRSPSLWSTFTGRPPAPWSVSIYVRPNLRAGGERRLSRAVERFVG